VALELKLLLVGPDCASPQLDRVAWGQLDRVAWGRPG
jgi:hypothetical protein